MTRRLVTPTRYTNGRPRNIEFESPGACTCRAFSGGRAVHNYGQPGCRYAQLDSPR
jgi:hypothetical protein